MRVGKAHRDVKYVVCMLGQKPVAPIPQSSRLQDIPRAPIALEHRLIHCISQIYCHTEEKKLDISLQSQTRTINTNQTSAN